MSWKTRFRCGCATVVAVLGILILDAAGAEPPGLKFSKRCLLIDMNEGCAVADVNRDGKLDVIAGEHWYAAPDFVPRPLRAIPLVEDLPGGLSGELMQNVADGVCDVNGDGWPDVISCGWTQYKGKEIYWYENPAGHYDEHTWKRHLLGTGPAEVESLVLHDFDGDGRPELFVTGWQSRLPAVIYKPTKDAKGQPTIQPVLTLPKGGHGYAFGDVNGDGLEDILCEGGWYERPRGDVFTQPWKHHPETALPHPSTPFIVAQLTDSGRNDIIWSKSHGRGLYWWQQGEPKPDGTTTWTEHLIDSSFSQIHVLAWADLDGDGQPELITGKRVRAHGPHGDTGSKEPEFLCYYHWNKTTKEFTRHMISEFGGGIGTGMRICVTDLNGDGWPDIVVAGKTGTWILFNQGPEKGATLSE